MEIKTIKLNKFKNLGEIAHVLNTFYKSHKKAEIIIEGCHAYPNISAPLSGILDFYRNKGMKIKTAFLPDGDDDFILKLNILNPYRVEDEENKKLLNFPFDKIWTFETSGGLNNLVNAFILALRKSDVAEIGNIQGLEWCLNEVMDNVLNHSQAGKGFVMAQYQMSQKLFTVCVFDCGIGIYNSFLDSKKYNPVTKSDAISLALQEKVTRDESVGQGNGLWGLNSIINKGNGQLRIVSDGAQYKTYFEDGKIEQRFSNNSLKFNFGDLGTTIIDFQLNINEKINVGEILKTNNYVDLWEEEFETDSGEYILKVSELSEGTGTRMAAKSLRNIALNILKNNKKIIIFDFDGANVISSSYADELFGKIITQYGLLYFMRFFKIINMNSLNIQIFERSVMQRMAQNYYDDKIGDLFTELVGIIKE